MFESKKKSEQNLQNPSEELAISTIPSEFYGGANPVIKFRGAIEKKQVDEPKQERPPTKLAAPTPGLFANQKFLVISAGLLFLLFISGAGLYYWFIGTQPTSPSNPVPKTPIVIATTSIQDFSTTTPEISIPTTPPDLTPSSTILQGGRVEFPSPLLGNTNDLDHDGLTDAEEEVFHTDSAVPDSDGDGYDDGTEIYNIYSPTDYAPTRLIATGYVKEFTNPVFNYRLSYPSDWAKANVDEGYKDMLFSTITGENIEVRVFDRDPGQSFDDWFGVWATGESLGALSNFSTVFKETGIARNDDLVYYFTDESHVFLIVYHLTGSDKVNYRAIITMMARSFRTPGNDKTITDMKVYTKPVGATSTPMEQVDYPKKR